MTSVEQQGGTAPTSPPAAIWHEQYQRMHRAFRQLVALAQGERFGDNRHSDEATDALVHFLQDAFHLKDWIKNDEDVAADDLRTAVERELFGDEGPVVMRLCADMANGAKHHKLDRRPRFGMSGIASEHVTVRPATAGSGRDAEPPLHSWALFADDHELDALTAARNILDEWDRWLASKGLVTPPRQ